jgi:hypothetical protein
MIQQFILEGFQSHQHTILDFVPGFNVIVGSGNSGKTAIFRGIRRLCRNLPRGTAFINRDMKECHLQLTTDAHILERTTTETRDVYQVDQVPYTKFGVTFPQKILEALPVDSVLDFSGVEIDLNFRMQHDPLFMLQFVPSLRAKILSKSLADLDILDAIVQEINREITTNQQFQEACHQRSADLAVEVDILTKTAEYLPAVEQLVAAWAVIENDQRFLDWVQAQLDVLAALAQDLEDLERSLLCLEKIPSAKGLVGLREFAVEFVKEQKLVDFLLDCESSVAQIEEQVRGLEGVEQFGETLQQLREQASVVLAEENLHVRVQRIGSQQAETNALLVVDTEQLKQAQDWLGSLMEQLTECPLCEQELEPLDKEAVLLNFHLRKQKL